MSREIKFRIWDKKSKSFITRPENLLLGNKYYIDCSGNIIIRDTIDFLHETNKNDFELMQFTGQKDTLGNEIFEDDFIIEMSEDGEYYLKLIGFGYDDREYSSILKGFKIVKGIELDLYVEEGSFKGRHAYLIDKYNIKLNNEFFENWIDYQVIGNKHENPELLELLEE